MRTFRLRPEGFNEVKRKMLTTALPISLIACLSGFYIFSANQETGVSSVDTLPFVIPIVLAAIAFGLFRALKLQKGMWDTYALTIDGDTITWYLRDVELLRLTGSVTWIPAFCTPCCLNALTMLDALATAILLLLDDGLRVLA